MPQNVTLYTLLISCPGDVKSEVQIVREVIEQFNASFSETLGITIQSKHWSKNSYPESGGKPQAILNEQIVNKCDAAVAIFWTRFGSPTDEYGSGTEEEIELMLESGKQVFMYFSDKPVAPTAHDTEGYLKVKAFREKYSDRGLYFTYSSDEEFKRLFFAHLTQHFLAQQKLNEVTDKYYSKLQLMGIDTQGKLSEHATIQEFKFNSETTTEQYIKTIRSTIEKISGMNIGSRASNESSILMSLTSLVEIDEEERKFITKVSEMLEMELPDNFFDLGNLGEKMFSSTPFNGPTLDGTDEEKEKYWLIKKLHRTISKVLKWAPIEKTFANKKCIKLALQNCGQAIDEDVEITFEIPKEELITINQFPKLETNNIQYLLNNCDLSILFGIGSTTEYSGYTYPEDSNMSYSSQFNGLPGYTPDYSEQFIEELESEFAIAKGNLRTSVLTEEEITTAYKNARELFLEGSVEAKRQLISLYLDKVLVFDDYVEVYLNALPLYIREKLIKKYRNSNENTEIAEIFGRGDRI